MSMKFPKSLIEDCQRSLGGTHVQPLEGLKNSTVVVTGGSGAIGLWIATLCAHLNDQHGFNIEIVLTARSRRRFEQKAPFLNSRSDIQFIEDDIRQFVQLPAKTDWVVHCAGTPDNRHHATNPSDTMAVIAEGTHRILRLTDQCVNLRMLLHFSSASVYGTQPNDMPAIPETYVGRVDSTSIISAYAEAKRYSETICASERSQSRTPVVIARPFALLGPFQPLDAPWAINNFLHAALNGQTLKVQGDGQSVRSYLYGSDLAVLALRMLTGGKSGAVFNLGHQAAYTLEQVAELVVQRVGRPLKILYHTAGRRAASNRLVPDMSQTNKLFQFEPAYDLADAVERTLQWNADKLVSTTNTEMPR